MHGSLEKLCQVFFQLVVYSILFLVCFLLLLCGTLCIALFDVADNLFYFTYRITVLFDIMEYIQLVGMRIE